MSKNYNHTLRDLFVAFLIICSLTLLYCIQSAGAASPENYQNVDNPRAYVKNSLSYLDNDNNTIIVGSVAKSPSQNFSQTVSVGLMTINNLTGQKELIIEKPYNTVLYKNDEPFPFKFVINSTVFPDAINSKPFIYKSENVTLPYTKINTINLEYPVLPQGEGKELYGNITNTSPVQLNNITLFAIVSDRNSSQIDSVETFIPTLKPYETTEFKFIPEPAIKDMVYFYSCVGGDINDMKVDEYKVVNLTSSIILGYKFSSLIQIDSLNYNNTIGEFNFTINNIYPYPGSLSLEVMPAQNVPLYIHMDDLAVQNTMTKISNNKTFLELSIPQGIHTISISNLN